MTSANDPLPRVHSSYLQGSMDIEQLPEIVAGLAARIEESGLEFNAIAFRGMSGALVSPMLALRLGKGFIVCRKPSENSHAGAAEGSLSCGGNYIIVDDFISSGRTVWAIVAAIEDYRERFNKSQLWVGPGWSVGAYKDRAAYEQIPEFKCAGVFLYDSSQTYSTMSKCEYDEDGEERPDGDKGYSIPVYPSR